MARKTIKEISTEGLSEEVWKKAEKNMLARERRSLRRAGRIRPFAIATPIVPDPNGHIVTLKGNRYTIGFESTFNKEKNSAA